MNIQQFKTILNKYKIPITLMPNIFSLLIFLIKNEKSINTLRTLITSEYVRGETKKVLDELGAEGNYAWSQGPVKRKSKIKKK